MRKFRKSKFYQLMSNIAEKNHPVSGNVRKIMLNLGVSIDELSLRSGIINTDLHKLLNDRRVIRPDEIVRLAKALGTDINTLFAESQFD